MTLDAKTLIPLAVGVVGALVGAGGMYVTRGEADCKAALAAAEVRVETCRPALAQCSAALDTITGRTADATP